MEGLSIQWITIPPIGGLAGQSIEDGQVRSRTGATIVAVIRGETSIPGPGPDFVLQPGDVVLLMGTDAAVEAAEHLLEG